MAKSIPALVTPAVLKWAREQVRMEPAVAAKRAAVTAEKLLSWEAEGEERPTLRQARALAAAYRQPLAAFYLDEVPQLKIHLPKDYRRFVGTQGEGVSSQIYVDVRDAWAKREIALELLAGEGRKPTVFKLAVKLEDDSEAAGEYLRGRLNVSMEEQSGWRDPRKAFNVWRARIEDLEVLVLQTSEIPPEEMRAYSLFAKPLPAIVVNRKDAPAARSFSLMHELSHLALHSEGLCDLTTEVKRSPEEQRLEVFCNAVAAACLIPESALLNHPVVKAHRSGKVWADAEIGELARTFSTSREALLRRLLTFELTSNKFYEQKRREYLEEYRSRPKVRAIVTPPVNALSLLGRPFVRLVLTNLDSGQITTSDATDYLGLRLKHFPALASSLTGE